jgi:hypothetical protein
LRGAAQVVAIVGRQVKAGVARQVVHFFEEL